MTTGVSEGLNLATQALLDDGDEVLSTDPSYVAYMPTVVFAGGRFVTVPAARRQRLQAARPRRWSNTSRPPARPCLLGYPANPTGAVMDRESLQAVADVVERNDLFVISDEIYDRLVYGVEHVSLPVAAPA